MRPVKLGDRDMLQHSTEHDVPVLYELVCHLC